MDPPGPELRTPNTEVTDPLRVFDLIRTRAPAVAVEQCGVVTAFAAHRDPEPRRKRLGLHARCSMPQFVALVLAF